MFLGCRTKNSTIIKKMTDESVGLSPGNSDPRMISWVVAAVRGMARSGPMARRTRVPKSIEKLLPTFFERLSMVPPDFTEATAESTTSPTPVVRKPSIDHPKSVPALNPSDGGNIRLPAPKNIEKRARLEIRIILVCFFIIVHFSIKL